MAGRWSPEFRAGPLLSLVASSSGVGSTPAPHRVEVAAEKLGRLGLPVTPLNQRSAGTPSLSRSAPGSCALHSEEEPSVEAQALPLTLTLGQPLPSLGLSPSIPTHLTWLVGTTNGFIHSADSQSARCSGRAEGRYVGAVQGVVRVLELLDGETEAQSLAHIRLGQACFLALHPQHFESPSSSRWQSSELSVGAVGNSAVVCLLHEATTCSRTPFLE